jgi:hypothetical protein
MRGDDLLFIGVVAFAANEFCKPGNPEQQIDDRQMSSFIPSMQFATLPVKDGDWRRR